MKILIINTHDIKGGAAKAAYRLHQALNQAGASSTMLVRLKHSNDNSVTVINDIYQGRSPSFDALPHYPYRKITHQLFSSAAVTNPLLLDSINNSDADIVHIHWIALGFLCLEDILKINKPVVFSLHDMWLFTGGCHYSQNCQSYRLSCQRCPTLQSTDENDLSNTNFIRKVQLFNTRPDITIVGLSRWIANEAACSTILRNNRIEQLPNPVNTNVFRPTDKTMAKQQLGLPVQKTVILFAADGGIQDPRKGYHYLDAILSGPLENHHLHIVTCGNNMAYKVEKGVHVLEHLPAIQAEEQMALLLSAADLVVLPSTQENLSNLVLESLSCGTPVIAFDIGGNSDMIKHLENGYLATFADSQDLANGIIWAISRQFESEKIRQQIVEHFAYNVIAEKYLKLYRSLLQKNQKQTTHIIMPNVLQSGSTADFEWTTSELENWIAAIVELKRPFILYGFGVFGRYLQSKLAQYCIATVDQNFASYQTQYPAIEFCDIERLNRLNNTLILISIYDPEHTIRHDIESRVEPSCKVLNLLEPFTIQEN